MRRFRRLRWLRRILVATVALGVALLVAGYAILASLDFEDLRDVLQTAAREATGRELVISGAVDLRISLQPAITLEEVSFANAAWGSRPNMMTVRRLELEAALLPLLSGKIRVKRLVLIEPDILLESDATGRANWLFSEADAGTGAEADDEDALAAVPSFDLIELRDGRLDYLHALSGTKLEILIDRLEAQTADDDEPLAFALEGTANGSPVGLEGEIGPLEALTDDEPVILAFVAKAAGASLTINGSMTNDGATPSLAATLAMEGASLGDLSGLSGTPLPAIGPYRLQAALLTVQGQGSLEGLSLAVGDSDLTGKLAFDIRGERPVVSGQFQSKAIHLQDFDKPVPGANEAPPSPYLFGESELPWAALAAADADLKVAVASLVVSPGLALQDLDLRVRLASGRLLVEPMTAQLAGGHVTGRLSLDGGQPEPPFSLRLEGQEVDYGQLLAAVGQDGSLAGRLAFTADLRGAGRSPRALAAGLSGPAEVVSNGGVVNDSLFKVLSVGLGDFLAPIFGGTDKTRLNCMVGRFHFNGGVGQSQGLIFDSEVMTVLGEGTIDLRDERLNLDFDTETREASLASLAVPFRVTGHLKDPQVAPDPLGAVAAVPGNVIGTGITALTEAGGLVTGLLGQDRDDAAVQSPCLLAAVTALPTTADSPTPAPEGTASQPSSAAASEPSPKTDGSDAGTNKTSGGIKKSEPGSGGEGGSSPGGDKSIDDALKDFKRDLNTLFGD